MVLLLIKAKQFVGFFEKELSVAGWCADEIRLIVKRDIVNFDAVTRWLQIDERNVFRCYFLFHNLETSPVNHIVAMCLDHKTMLSLSDQSDQ